MTNIFLKLVDMSLSASWIILAVIAARLVLKKAPKWVICALWALVALRLVCPFTPESALSLIPEMDFTQEVSSAGDSEDREVLAVYSHSTETVPPGETGKMEGYGVISDSNNNVLLVKDLQKTEPEATLNLSQVFSALWLVGFVVMLTYAAISYLRIRQKVSASIDLGTGVYICDYIDTPFILGIIKPKIYLPSAMDPADAAYVLAHERAHLKRKDHWWKPLGFLLLAVHWFNPLIWVSYILLCRDIELACDERVVKTMDAPEKKGYSEALLKCSVPRRMIAVCPLAFGEVDVKQRVKSVLHYKKPGFSIILISLVVIAVVALCFLTDPESHTLANILEIQEKEVLEINVWSRKGRITFETPEEISEFLDFLDTIEYDTTPAASEPIEGEVDENDWSYRTIEINYGDTEEVILLDYDYTLVWTRDADGTNSLPYTVKDPDILTEFLNDNVTPVLNRNITAKGFATAEEPGKWLQNIHLNAIKTSWLYVVNPDQTLRNTYLTNAQVTDLLKILNTIPESALSNEQYDDNFNYSDLRYFSSTSPTFSGASLTIVDGASELTAVLRLYDNKLELVLMDGMHSLNTSAPYDDTGAPARIWAVDHQGLRDLMTAMLENPPYLLTFSSSRYNLREEKEVISDGSLTISTAINLDWDHEIIQPEDEEDFFGFRCRPKAESEGWVCFGWWGDNFIPADIEEEWVTNMYGYHYTYTTGALEYSQSGDPVYYRYYRSHCMHGDFVILYEGCDAWIEEYRDDISFYKLILTLYCDPHLELTDISDRVFSALANVAYYDWDAIARELGTQSLTLFDPQYYEDYLFMGLAYDNDYQIACFRQAGNWDYQFVGLLDPTSKFLPHDKTQVTPVAEFETEDSPWLLYIIDDEAVTGVECNAGLREYIPIDTHPALVLLDEALWGTGENAGVAFDLRYDEPPSLYLSTESDGSRFKFIESSQYYLYDCLVKYNDGQSPSGSCSLEPQELKELASILLSLPELTENASPENFEDSFDAASTNPSGAQVYMQLHLDRTSLYSWSQNGVQRTDWGDVRLELYYRNGSITLGVNMADLHNNFYQDAYYYKVESPELEAFMLSKCDESPKRVSLFAE